MAGFLEVIFEGGTTGSVFESTVLRDSEIQILAVEEIATTREKIRPAFPLYSSHNSRAWGVDFLGEAIEDGMVDAGYGSVLVLYSFTLYLCDDICNY